MSDVRFCWLCGNKLWGNHKEELVIDDNLKTLHKKCAKDIKSQQDYHKNKDGTYSSQEWMPAGWNF